MLNKAILMHKTAKATKLPLREASMFIDVIFEEMADTISRGERIELRGFGTFFTMAVSQKKYPSSLSSQKVVPAHGRIVFRPCQKLRESVWNKVVDN